MNKACTGGFDSRSITAALYSTCSYCINMSQHIGYKACKRVRQLAPIWHNTQPGSLFGTAAICSGQSTHRTHRASASGNRKTRQLKHRWASVVGASRKLSHPALVHLLLSASRDPTTAVVMAIRREACLPCGEWPTAAAGASSSFRLHQQSSALRTPKRLHVAQRPIPPKLIAAHGKNLRQARRSCIKSQHTP